MTFKNRHRINPLGLKVKSKKSRHFETVVSKVRGADTQRIAQKTRLQDAYNSVEILGDPNLG